ncbi:hypothetical protein TIFTF001_025329 [Ficus carica]|uniref:Uncharacterized protein n=1 Tax=Ficus carica TaxID=3494 RepID=A0AA88ANK0_FICCA|nr:hypothetical protein TIFTF001_025329 [Ficus carica]
MWKPRLSLRALCWQTPHQTRYTDLRIEADNHITADLTSRCWHYTDANPELMLTQKLKSKRHHHSGRTPKHLISLASPDSVNSS